MTGFLYWSTGVHWTVYKNSEYGFKISIPEDFRIKNNPYSINDHTNFDLIITDSADLAYLEIEAFNKPSDYKEPSGPFPEITLNEKGRQETEPYVFNNINGFRIKGGAEGGGGNHDYFEFVHNGKVWRIEFFAEEENYPEHTFDETVYLKIKNSFLLTK